MSGGHEETARRHSEIRREIVRTLAGAAPAMAMQAARMRALGEGKPDPHPEADGEFMDRIIEERRTGTERTHGWASRGPS